MKEKNEELRSLNNDLLDEFYLEKLEERLETNPFLLNGFWSDAPSGEELTPFALCNEFACAIY